MYVTHTENMMIRLYIKGFTTINVGHPEQIQLIADFQ